MYLQALVLRKSEHAADQAKKVLALYPDDWQVLYLNAVVENRSGQFSDARRHLHRSIALNRSYAPARAELGKVLQELGDLSSAKTELETAEPWAISRSMFSTNWPDCEPLEIKKTRETRSARSNNWKLRESTGHGQP